jgi:DNA invertase Pin-like site-specific DNA recombinase
MRVLLYGRVSRDDQDLANQWAALEQVAAERGWQIIGRESDEGISGAKGKDKRPGLARVYGAIEAGAVDLVAVWSVDRLGRSLIGLLEVMQLLHAKGVDLYMHQNHVDTTTPGGKAMFQMMGVFAEFERSMISARIKASIVRGKAAGKVYGPKRKWKAGDIARVHTLKADGKSCREIAAELNMGLGTVGRICSGA